MRTVTNSDSYMYLLSFFGTPVTPVILTLLRTKLQLQLQHYTVLCLYVHSSSWVQLMWW